MYVTILLLLLLFVFVVSKLFVTSDVVVLSVVLKLFVSSDVDVAILVPSCIISIAVLSSFNSVEVDTVDDDPDVATTESDLDDPLPRCCCVGHTMSLISLSPRGTRYKNITVASP